MTALKWAHVDLLNGVLTVKEGKGEKTAWVALSQTLAEALEGTVQREGFVLPCRASQSVYERVESLCRRAKVRFKGVHALRHSSGTRLHEETGDIVLLADHLIKAFQLGYGKGLCQEQQHQGQEGRRGVVNCHGGAIRSLAAGCGLSFLYCA